MDLSTYSDGRLLDLFLQGDQSAFEEVLRRHARMVLNVCTRQLRDAHLAEDAAQAVFLTLAHKASSLRSRTDIAGWLHTVAWHVASRGRAAEQHRTKRELRAANMQTREAISDADTWNELSPRLDAELQALPEKFQAPLLLHYLEGVSEADGARRLNLPLGTFSSRLARAREMLRERLTQRGAPVHSAGFALLLMTHAGSAQTSAEFIAATAKAAVWIKSGNAAAAVVSAQTESFLSTAQNALFKTQVKVWAKMAAMVAFILTAALVSLSNAKTQVPAGPSATREIRGDKPAPAEFVRVLGAGDFQAPQNIEKVALNADCTQLATAGGKYVLIWDIKTKQVVSRLKSDEYFYDVAWLRDGRLIVLLDATMGNRNGGLFIWNPADDSRKWLMQDANHSLINVRNFTLTDDQSTVLIPSGKSENQGSTLNAIDVATGRTIFALQNVVRSAPNLNFGIKASALSADARRVLGIEQMDGARNNAPFDFESTRVFIWDLAEKKIHKEWILPKGTSLNYGAQPRWLGSNIYFEGQDKAGECTLLYNADTGALVKRLPGIGIYDAAGKRWILFNKGRISFLNDGEEKPAQSFAVGEISWLKSLRLSPDGQWLVGSTSSQAFLLADLKERKALAPDFNAHRNTPYGMSFLPDGRLWVYDGTRMRMYDSKTGAECQSFNGRSYYSYGRNASTPDGRMFLQVGQNDGRPQVWDSVRCELLGHLTAHTGGGCSSIQVSPDGSQVLTTGEYDGLLQLHDLPTNRPVAQWKGMKHKFFRNVLHLDSAHWVTFGTGGAAVTRLILADTSPSWFHAEDRNTPEMQKTVGLSGAYDTTTGTRLFRFLDESGKEIETIRNMQICAFRDLAFFNAVTQNAQTLISTDRFGIWKASTGKFIRNVDNPGQFARFSPDGRRVIGNDAIVDADTGKTLARFAGKTYRSVSPSGTLVAEVGPTLRILETRTGSELWRYTFSTDSDNFEIGAFAWGADEATAAIVWKKECPVNLVKLFQHERVAENELTPTALAAAAKDLTGTDAARVLKAQSLLIQAGAASLPLLPKNPAAIYVLESIARESGVLKSPAADILRDIASISTPEAGLATDALLRLRAREVQDELSERHKNPEKLRWPQVEKKDAGEF